MKMAACFDNCELIVAPSNIWSMYIMQLRNLYQGFKISWAVGFGILYPLSLLDTVIN